MAAACSSVQSVAAIVPRFTAEEMALHLALAQVPDLLGCRRPFGGTYRGVFETLPACDTRDTDYLLLSELLLDDEDVLWLFDPQMDGIDDDSSELAARLGTANLHARDWFRSFQPQANPAPELVPARPGHLRLSQSG